VTVRILSATDVRSIFTPQLALESQREAFTRLGAGEAVQPPLDERDHQHRHAVEVLP